jgi:hypothetical protein
MLSEHTVVLANEKINEKIDKGCLGVIVYVYGNDVYEVEFFDENKRTIDLCTVFEYQIQENTAYKGT